jgi:hypothetical protein
MASIACLVQAQRPGIPRGALQRGEEEEEGEEEDDDDIDDVDGDHHHHDDVGGSGSLTCWSVSGSA